MIYCINPFCLSLFGTFVFIRDVYKRQVLRVVRGFEFGDFADMAAQFARRDRVKGFLNHDGLRHGRGRGIGLVGFRRGFGLRAQRPRDFGAIPRQREIAHRLICLLYTSKRHTDREKQTENFNLHAKLHQWLCLIDKPSKRNELYVFMATGKRLFINRPASQDMARINLMISLASRCAPPASTAMRGRRARRREIRSGQRGGDTSQLLNILGKSFAKRSRPSHRSPNPCPCNSWSAPFRPS